MLNSLALALANWFALQEPEPATHNSQWLANRIIHVKQTGINEVIYLFVYFSWLHIELTDKQSCETVSSLGLKAPPGFCSCQIT